MKVRIVQLPQDRTRDAISTLTRAFMPDPIFSFYFPDSESRAEVFDAFFNDIVCSHIRFGHVYGAILDGTVVGAAVWRPPDAGEPTTADRERSFAAERRVRDMNHAAADRLFEGFATLERYHPPEPHWYLFFAGIEPELQGRGIGSTLLSPVLKIADRAETLCYLETPFPRTHAFYRTLGYEIARESNPFAGAPKVWTMLRKYTNGRNKPA
jgi:ribosomal protein S18 acetylase RimI-like enzyme